jgi:O-antigen/teichoic acid export membrane protein
MVMLVPVVPLVLLRDFARRFAFAHLRMTTAFVLDSCVAVVQIGGIVALLTTGRLNAVSAFVVMGIAAGIGGSMALLFQKADFAPRVTLLRSTLATHWAYGRWVLASTSMGIAQGYLVHWLLAFTTGTVDTGVFAACMTLVLLINPLLHAMGNVLEPKAARAIVEHGHQHLRRMIWHLCLALAAAMLVYFAVLLFAGGWLVSAIYAGSEFTGRGHLIAVLALSMIVTALGLPVAHGLRAMDRPDLNFRAAGVALLLTLLAGLMFVPRYGMLLGAYALLIGTLGGTTMRIWLFIRLSTGPHIPLRGLHPAVDGGPRQST